MLHAVRVRPVRVLTYSGVYATCRQYVHCTEGANDESFRKVIDDDGEHFSFLRLIIFAG